LAQSEQKKLTKKQRQRRNKKLRKLNEDTKVSADQFKRKEELRKAIRKKQSLRDGTALKGAKETLKRLDVPDSAQIRQALKKLGIDARDTSSMRKICDMLK
jgi:mRNA-degrading endonuclease RelE of RelBE toxin-antitoxin system